MAKSNEKKAELACFLTVISVFCLGQIPGSIDAAISKIAETFNLSQSSGLYVTTVASLTSVAIGLIIGFVAGKKIGYKPLIFICSIIEMISAIAPFFIKSFWLILIFRGLFGIGFGAMQSLENAVATILIPADKRAKILGLGTFFGFGCNCILQLIGGVLADIGWNYVFLNHLILLIPFFMIIFLCPNFDEVSQENAHDPLRDSNEPNKDKLSPKTYLMWVTMLFVGIFIAPLLIGASFLSAPINPSAFVAGIVCVAFSIGCMVGGLSYPKLFKVLKGKSISVFILMIIIGLIGCGLSRNIPLLCVLIFVAGMGFSMTQASCMMVLGLANSTAKIAIASACMMSLFNLGMFLSSSFESLVGMITGDSLYNPLYIGAGVLAVFAVGFFVKSPIPNGK